MTPSEINGMSSVNQVILGQVAAQVELLGATLRKGSDRLRVAIRELGPNTLRLSNLQATDSDDALFVSVAIRYRSARGVYDALVAHAYCADNGFDIAYRFELIKGLHANQFEALFSGEYFDVEGNAITVEDAYAWEKAEVPNLLIFSASEKACSGAGYWSNQEGWVESPRHASLFSTRERESIAPSSLPFAAGNDAVWAVAPSANNNYQMPPRKVAGMST